MFIDSRWTVQRTGGLKGRNGPACGSSNFHNILVLKNLQGRIKPQRQHGAKGFIRDVPAGEPNQLRGRSQSAYKRHKVNVFAEQNGIGIAGLKKNGSVIRAAQPKIANRVCVVPKLSAPPRRQLRRRLRVSKQSFATPTPRLRRKPDHFGPLRGIVQACTNVC